MSGRRRRRASDDEDDSSIGSAVATGVAVAGIAALVYGAKKLYDYVTEEQNKDTMMEGATCGSQQYEQKVYTAPSSIPEVGYQSPPGGSRDNTSYSQYRTEVSRQTVPKVLPPISPSTVSLSQRLTDYRIHVTPCEVNTEIRDIITDISKGLMAASHTVVAIANPEQVVSKTTSLHHLTMTLGDTWKLQSVDASYDMIDSPVAYDIVGSVDASAGPYSRYVVRNDSTSNLSCCAVQQAVKDHLIQVLHEVKQEHPHHTMSVTDNGACAIIDRNNESVSVRYIPTITLSDGTGKQLTVTPLESNGRYMWMESYTLREITALYSMSSDQCCHLDCLRIMANIARNHPAQFMSLDIYIYRTILLHMIAETPEEDLWYHECLQEQFVDMLNQLVCYLQAHKLPHYFQPEINLLAKVPKETCDMIVDFILTRIGKEKLHTLLVIEKGQE